MNLPISSCTLILLNLISLKECINTTKSPIYDRENSTLPTVRVIFNLSNYGSSKSVVKSRVTENFAPDVVVTSSNLKKLWGDVRKCLFLIAADCQTKCEEEVPGLVNSTIKVCFEKVHKTHHSSYVNCIKAQEAVLDDTTPCWDSGAQGELFRERELDIITQMPWLLQSVSCWRNCMGSDRDRCYNGCAASPDSTVAQVSRDCQKKIRRKDLSTFKSCIQARK